MKVIYVFCKIRTLTIYYWQLYNNKKNTSLLLFRGSWYDFRMKYYNLISRNVMNIPIFKCILKIININVTYDSCDNDSIY